MWCVWRERNAQSFRGCWNCSWTLKLLLLKTLYDLMAARTYFSFSNLFGVSLLIKKKKNLFGVSFVYFPCTLHIGCASFLHIYIGQPQECMKDCISIISNGTQGCMKDCLICDDEIEIYIVIEFWLLTLHVPLTNVLIFLLCFHFSAYRKLARSYHPDVNKWVLFPLLFSLSFGNVCSHCSGWASVISELLIGFVRYELFVLGHFSFENLLHMFVIRF